MGSLTAWQQLPAGGAVRPESAPRPRTGGWRTGERPEVDTARCVDCLLWWLYCPDSAVTVADEHFAGIDLDHCKGCAICAEVCPVQAIEMVAE